MTALQKMSRAQLALIGIALSIVLFVAANLLAQLTLTTTRLDLTEEGLFTLSPSTVRVLETIDEPIDLRFYYSDELDELGPRIKTHAERVDELLDTYARLSDGRLRLERLSPEPFSATEDLAVAEGIREIPIDVDGTLAYFGISGRNSTDDLQVIDYLAPERSEFLEYDLTRLVYDLANPNKPVVAVLGDLPIMGTQQNQFQPWLVLEAMFQFFDVRFLGGTQERIDDDVEVLLLTQPQSLDETGLYAVDQFVMRGGKVVAFVDPHPEFMNSTGPMPGAPGEGNAIETLAPLLSAWGVTIPTEQVVGDGRLAERVSARIRGRDAIVAYLPWIGLGRSALAADDVVTADLERISVRSAGWIEPSEEAGTTLTPLLTSSADAMPLDVEDLEGQPDLAALLSSFAPTGETYVIAARVTGPVSSAFPDGPPMEEAEREDFDTYIGEAEAPLNLVLVADTDLLADQSWLQQQNLLGQDIVVPVANNADFAVNIIDNLAGSEGLIDLRGRGLSIRPFEVVQAMQRDAEIRFRAKEEELLQRIAETEDKIAALQQQEEGANGIIPTEAEEEEIEAFRAEMIELRSELREVQRSLRADVEALSFRIQALNIAAIPALIALVAIALAATRWLRNRRRIATA